MLDVETRGQVGVITLNNPSRRNALQEGMVNALDRAVGRFAADPEIGAVVLRGAAPSFCAGSDLKELGKMNLREMADHEANTASVARRMQLAGIPLVATTEGVAIGGGFVLAISCDLVVTAEDTKWTMAEVPNGWLPPWGLEVLCSRVGPVAARRLVWGFEMIDGAQAHAMGVADYVTAAGESEQKAFEIAEKLAALPRAAVASTKQYFRAAMIGKAEAGDAAANEAFLDNCQFEAAKATLQKFGVKS